MSDLKATVIVDNIESEGLNGEWGLCIYIEYKGKKVLLDSGASALFQQNAEVLGIRLSDVEIAVLSHAHYDHANGMPAFFECNRTASFWLSDACRENCYADKDHTEFDYIGIPVGTLEAFPDRIHYVTENVEIADGIHIIRHDTPDLAKIGARERLYVKNDDGFAPDDFAHEQSLVFETEKGLVIFNSCCHAGADTIVREIRRSFPDKHIHALIGGFHLFNRSADEVRAFADQLKAANVEFICTGHCTGAAAYDILKDALGEVCHQLRCGLQLVF